MHLLVFGNILFSVILIDISHLFIYYNGQMIEQETLRVEDLGANQRDIALGLTKYRVFEKKT